MMYESMRDGACERYGCSDDVEACFDACGVVNDCFGCGGINSDIPRCQFKG
jgi:hypothetical protein